jgi:hypothetical protein
MLEDHLFCFAVKVILLHFMLKNHLLRFAGKLPVASSPLLMAIRRSGNGPCRWGRCSAEISAIQSQLRPIPTHPRTLNRSKTKGRIHLTLTWARDSSENSADMSVLSVALNSEKVILAVVTLSVDRMSSETLVYAIGFPLSSFSPRTAVKRQFV